MEPLHKLHWFGILTAFLPFLMFTSAQITSPHYDFHMRENLSPVFYNPSKTNPLSDQMGKLQRIAEAQPEAEATAVANPNAKAEADYRGKRSAIAEADPNAEAEAYGYGYGRGYGYGGYGGYRGGYGGYGYGGYRGKRSAEEEEAKPEEVKPGSFAYPFYGYDAHYEPPQIGWPGVHTPPYCFGCRGKRSAQGQQVQKTAGPGGAPLRRLSADAEPEAEPAAEAYYGYYGQGYGYNGYGGNRYQIGNPYGYGNGFFG